MEAWRAQHQIEMMHVRERLRQERAREDAARQVAQADADERAALIGEARAAAAKSLAARRWPNSGGALTPEIARFIPHVVDLARETPAARILWVEDGRRSAELVGRDNAAAFVRARTITIWPITSEALYATALHELGHIRTPDARGKLQREAAAWRWAREHARAWTPAMQRSMREAATTYLKVATKDDTLGAFDLEGVIGEDEYAREKDRRRTMRHRQWQREHGIRRCQARHCLGSSEALAVARWEVDVCARCDDARRTGAAAHALQRARAATTATERKRATEAINTWMEA